MQQLITITTITTGLGLWVAALGLTAWGAYLSVRQFRFRNSRSKLNSKRLPISILKPIKGVDENLEADLSSFFDLEYPSYEIIFSIASHSDPAIQLVKKLIVRFPKVRARLIVGDVHVGPNPKVNNLIRSYDEATNDWILISDSNVRVDRDYLNQVTAKFADDVGVVTAVVTGVVAPRKRDINLGAHLEATFLNTFYTRWMLVSKSVGIPVVVGKCMLFRRSQANRFGGISALGRYLAEDYMAGQAMKLLGYKTEIMNIGLKQPLGKYPLQAFWSRHLRWGRIRKSQAPQAFAIEPLLCLWLSGIIGALSLRASFGIAISHSLLFHVGAWLTCDLAVMLSLGTRIRLSTIPAWLLRETLHLPLWLHIASGNSVNWRGQRLVLSRGGTVSVDGETAFDEAPACESASSISA